MLMADTKHNQEVKMITLRAAAEFGSKLALDLAEKLQTEHIEVFKWPERFPITISRIEKLPEVNKNNKVAKRASEAAKAVWKEIRNEAMAMEAFILANPELSEPNIKQDSYWRQLFMELEQAAGNIFLTDCADEEAAKNNVHKMLAPKQLKVFLVEFEDDYKNFIDEIREKIRSKKSILASKRLELICALNTNTKAAKKLLTKEKKKQQ
jgi:hypothetical protein